MGDRSRIDLVIYFECNNAEVYMESDGQERAGDSYLPGDSAQTAPWKEAIGWSEHRFGALSSSAETSLFAASPVSVVDPSMRYR